MSIDRAGASLAPSVAMKSAEQPPVSAVGVSIGAGAALLAVMCLDAGLRGDSPFLPFRLTASLVLGESAVESTESSTVLLGMVIGTGTAMVDGLLFTRLMFRLPDAISRSWSRRILVGMAFGAAVYVVAFQLVGRFAFPWVLRADQPGWLVGHALVFGPLLAVMHLVAVLREDERLDAIGSPPGRTGSHGNPTGESS